MAMGVFAAAALSCAGGRSDRQSAADHTDSPAESDPELAGGDSDDEAPAPPIDAAVTLSEAAARAFLSDRFRRAGFRVRYDVRVRIEGAFDVTFDGYDPEHRVGFEYVAEVEANTDVVDGERAALAEAKGYRLFVIDAVDGAVLIAATEMFLSSVPSPE